MAKLGLQKWTLGLVATAAAISLGAACGGDDDDNGFSATGGVGTDTGGAGTTGGQGGAVTGTGGAGGASSDGGQELVNAEGWIDDVNGIRGSFYQYGDNITCTATEGNPCTADGCCLDWATIVDAEYLSWGCGIGMELNSDGGDPAVKSPYTGTGVIGFQVTIAGDVPDVRLGLTQLPDTTDIVSPFVPQVSGPGTYDVLFGEVTCPEWGIVKGCVDNAVATSSHDLQIQVVGGEAEASGRLCITSVKPILAQ